MRRLIPCFGFMLLASAIAPQALAGPPKLKKPPPPLNKQVKYEAYPNTDIAMITFLTSRQEFRVGHSPYKAERFHLAEFILVSEHYRKYLRPDFKAEIKMAPGRDKPELMANKTFQQKWKDQLKNYETMLTKFKKVETPKLAAQVVGAYQKPMEYDLALARALAKRMFASQQIRARELLRQDLQERFRARNTEWFDRLFDDFEREADLSKFYPRFVDLFIEPGLIQAKQDAESQLAQARERAAEMVRDTERRLADLRQELSRVNAERISTLQQIRGIAQSYIALVERWEKEPRKPQDD